MLLSVGFKISNFRLTARTKLGKLQAHMYAEFYSKEFAKKMILLTVENFEVKKTLEIQLIKFGLARSRKL
jgi:hypothetical protein